MLPNPSREHFALTLGRALGHLPGDIRIEREAVRVYFPVVSMLLVSIVASILLSVFRR
jgi:ABC-type transport system involved in cytochrome bd biosynthesis fused ATPase/permease subunit